jgi:hypothetical protein
VPEYALLDSELPPPSAEMVLWRITMQALLASLPRKRAERLLREAAETLAAEENLTSVLQIRPVKDHAAVRQARRQAAAIYARYLPLFLAGLPD